MFVYYGKDDIFIDVSDKVINGNNIVIPATDIERFKLIGIDPCPGVLKVIKIIDSLGTTKIFQSGIPINIPLDSTLDSFLAPEEILYGIHSNIKLKHGNKSEEYPEQLMAVTFIKPEDRVLEIGANIGRNTLVISSILENDENLVTLECDLVSVGKLQENRDINKRNFKIEPSALSAQPLIQKDWNTFPHVKGTPIPRGYTQIRTITLEELRDKYNINFNVLVLDCEGAFYYILRDMEDILNGIEKIIIENDFTNIQHKIFVDEILIKRGFSVKHSSRGGWGPCFEFFFQVWTV